MTRVDGTHIGAAIFQFNWISCFMFSLPITQNWRLAKVFRRRASSLRRTDCGKYFRRVALRIRNIRCLLGPLGGLPKNSFDYVATSYRRLSTSLYLSGQWQRAPKKDSFCQRWQQAQLRAKNTLMSFKKRFAKEQWQAANIIECVWHALIWVIRRHSRRFGYFTFGNDNRRASID